MKSCENCQYAIKIKNFNGFGICEEDDGRINKVIKNCPRHKAKKYKRQRG